MFKCLLIQNEDEKFYNMKMKAWKIDFGKTSISDAQCKVTKDEVMAKK